MATWDQGGGCSCGLQKVCDCKGAVKTDPPPMQVCKCGMREFCEDRCPLYNHHPNETIETTTVKDDKDAEIDRLKQEIKKLQDEIGRLRTIFRINMYRYARVPDGCSLDDEIQKALDDK